jgi:hypothetical protein
MRRPAPDFDERRKSVPGTFLPYWSPSQRVRFWGAANELDRWTATPRGTRLGSAPALPPGTACICGAKRSERFWASCSILVDELTPGSRKKLGEEFGGNDII